MIKKAVRETSLCFSHIHMVFEFLKWLISYDGYLFCKTMTQHEYANLVQWSLYIILYCCPFFCISIRPTNHAAGKPTLAWPDWNSVKWIHAATLITEVANQIHQPSFTPTLFGDSLAQHHLKGETNKTIMYAISCLPFVIIFWGGD